MKISIIQSILAINTNAVVNVTADDINQIEWLFNTPIISNEVILAKQSELQIEEDNKEIIKEQNKQSALNKLKALGLNDAEIKAIIGI